MVNGKIIVQIGKKQVSFGSGEIHSSEDCDMIESLVSCNKTKLSEHGGSGRIRFLDENGFMVVQLTIDKDNLFLSCESKSIVVIRSRNNSIKSSAYFGTDCDLDFVSSAEEYYMDGVNNHIESIKSFYKSWQAKKGSISSVVIIVDNRVIYDKIIKDSFFNNCYVLLAY